MRPPEGEDTPNVQRTASKPITEDQYEKKSVHRDVKHDLLVIVKCSSLGFVISVASFLSLIAAMQFLDWEHYEPGTTFEMHYVDIFHAHAGLLTCVAAQLYILFVFFLFFELLPGELHKRLLYPASAVGISTISAATAYKYYTDRGNFDVRQALAIGFIGCHFHGTTVLWRASSNVKFAVLSSIGVASTAMLSGALIVFYVTWVTEVFWNPNIPIDWSGELLTIGIYTVAASLCGKLFIIQGMSMIVKYAIPDVNEYQMFLALSGFTVQIALYLPGQTCMFLIASTQGFVMSALGSLFVELFAMCVFVRLCQSHAVIQLCKTIELYIKTDKKVAPTTTTSAAAAAATLAKPLEQGGEVEYTKHRWGKLWALYFFEEMGEKVVIMLAATLSIFVCLFIVETPLSSLALLLRMVLLIVLGIVVDVAKKRVLLHELGVDVSSFPFPVFTVNHFAYTACVGCFCCFYILAGIMNGVAQIVQGYHLDVAANATLVSSP